MSRTARNVWIRKAQFEICVQWAEVEHAELNGDVIGGKWIRKGDKQWNDFFKPPTTLVEDFLNWPRDEGAILKFTKRWGPLLNNPYEHAGITMSRPLYGASWSFPLDSWRVFQDYLQQEWEWCATKYATKKHLGQFAFDVLSRDGELLGFYKGQDLVQFQAANLSRFLKISLWSMPAERLKKCARTPEKGCPTPYFFAQHLRQEYCSGPCAAWAQKEWKKEWWKRRTGKTSKSAKGGTRH